MIFKIREKVKWEYMGIDPEIRKNRGITQQELADLTDGEISVRTIQNYENGLTDIGAKNLILLSQILRTTPSSLLKVPIDPEITDFDYIFRYIPVGNGFRPKTDELPYRFLHNIKKSRDVGYYILEEDSHILGAPKGAKVIFDVMVDYNNLFEKNKGWFYGVIFEHGPGRKIFHVTKFIDAGNDRRVNNYLYIDRWGYPQQVNQYDIREILFAIVKKVIIDF